MKNNQALLKIGQWKEHEPVKFVAWTWFGRGIKEAERFAIVNGGENITTPLGKAVAEFEEHWRYERAEALAELTRLGEEEDSYDEDPYFHLKDNHTVGGIINTTEE